jgi:hypothetical protein
MNNLKDLCARESRAMRGFRAALVLFFVLLPGIAFSATVSVDCSTGGDLQAAINGLDPAVGNFINVTGTCGNGTQTFSVTGFRSLTIRADPAAGGSATLAGLAVPVCGAVPPPAGIRTVLNIQYSDFVGLQNLNISGGAGLVLIDSLVFFQGNVHVSGALSTGVSVAGGRGSSLTMTGTGNEVGDNCSVGISVGPGSAATNNAHIHDNGVFGMAGAGNIITTGDSIIEDNGAAGMFGSAGTLVNVAGNAIIRNNGHNPNPSPNPPPTGGVVTQIGAILIVTGPPAPSAGVLIENNGGDGIFADLNSSVVISGNVTVQSNAESGVSLLHQSVAKFDNLGGLASPQVRNNLKKEGDLDCDESSLAYGDLKGVGKNKCDSSKKNK